ncbi:MAG: ankyrin repeat domain-containing protein [Firmicutes bacterium]|nr:ankyrin repeat domain-containing protein [Bacillota bacterium]
MNKTQKKAVIIFTAIIVLIGGTIMIFTLTNNSQSVKASKQLVIAIGDHDLLKVEEIVKQYPKSVNTLPSMSPWWWQLISEQPPVSFPLQRACWGGDYDIVKLLIDNGADANLVWKGIEGSKSPMMRSVLSGSERTQEIVELLLEHGADKSIKDSSGKTAYDYAVEEDNLELAELLKP